MLIYKLLEFVCFDICLYLSSTYPLPILYLTSTYPLPNLYKQDEPSPYNRKSQYAVAP